MNNKTSSMDIYLMGIGGTAMGSFAGLLKSAGHRVMGSDAAVYSPMKEKLDEWKIKYLIPYDEKNLSCSRDLVIVGNVIKKTNPEVKKLLQLKLPYTSFPQALSDLFLRHHERIVACGTHGKTTCSSLMAHTLDTAMRGPGFLIGGVPLNFNEGFRLPKMKESPFVVEGDEYDTAFFDKRPKFLHYKPNHLLISSLEFDHADIYKDIDAIINAFQSLISAMGPKDNIIFNKADPNIKKAIARSKCQAQIICYGDGSDYRAEEKKFYPCGIEFLVRCRNKRMGKIFIPLFGQHNLENALGCYATLHSYGLTHQQIDQGFRTFMGVKRRLEERTKQNNFLIIDDFAHHPTAVKASILATKQKYPEIPICAIFEPRSATSCTRIFQHDFEKAFSYADAVMIAPVGREIDEAKKLDTQLIAQGLRLKGINANAYGSYHELKNDLLKAKKNHVLLFMSNGDFNGLLQEVIAGPAK